ncbi:MAG: serine hydrolase [Armatimonas sp.]
MNTRRSFLTGAVGSALLLGDATVSQAAKSRLPRAKPESVGIDPAGILRFTEAVDTIGLHSLMLLRHGKVAAEGWWNPYGPQHPHMLYSLSKSFTSTAIGLLISEGKLSKEAAVVSFFPNERPATIEDNLAAMQVQHLLMMGTGHDIDTTGAVLSQPQGDWVRGFFSVPVAHAPTTKFVYNTGATYMLSAILQTVTGQTVLDYLRPRLFGPLGIQNPTWETCPKGRNAGGFGLSITTEDIAKFGQLYLQKGMWDGKQLVPAAWVADATQQHISNGDPKTPSDWAQGYGYQFWRCRHDAYRGDGAFGQFCVVLPEKDAVIAITSGTGDMQGILNAAWEHLLPAYDRTPSPAPTLSTRLKRLALTPPAGAADSTMAKQIQGKTFTFEKNALGAVSVRFDSNLITLKLANEEQQIRWKGGRWEQGTVSLGSFPSKKAATYGAWSAPDTLALTICAYETPYIRTITCQFQGDSITLAMKDNVSFGPNGVVTLKGRA